MEFVELNNETLDAAAVSAKIANLHDKSASPTGMFGFHVTTFQGPCLHNNDWSRDWCFFFTRLLSGIFAQEIERNGSSPEYEIQFGILKDTTIPRILKPLQSDGNDLKPSLIHGDLWEGNAGTSCVSGQPIIFDAGALYAHNELEAGMWRREDVRLGDQFMNHYLEHIPPSEPRIQWDDRNRLYSIKYDLAHSTARPETSQIQRAR